MSNNITQSIAIQTNIQLIQANITKTPANEKKVHEGFSYHLYLLSQLIDEKS